LKVSANRMQIPPVSRGRPALVPVGPPFDHSPATALQILYPVHNRQYLHQQYFPFSEWPYADQRALIETIRPEGGKSKER
jgi:hypothetical protein